MENPAHFVCESFIRGACQNEEQCASIHCNVPYLWQVRLPGEVTWNVLHENEEIEAGYCDPNYNTLTLTLAGAQLPDGTYIQMEAVIDFKCFKAVLNPQGLTRSSADVRRLSTLSYVHLDGVHEDNKCPVDEFSHVLFPTQWRWYWYGDGKWEAFGKPGLPPQSVLESKFLHGQVIYRFDTHRTSKSTKTHKELNMLLNMKTMTLKCLNDSGWWEVRRRPLFISREQISQGKFLLSPKVIPLPIPEANIPEDWAPIDMHTEYELVPLDPESTKFHLVAGELLRSLPNAKTQDIFRLQNAFLWNKYLTKRQCLLARNHSTDERQLFHGTPDLSVIQAIFRQNFDSRVCGKNATCFGKGCYFAADARYSHRYNGDDAKNKLKWLFLARVLVGQFTVGKPEYTRPPPIDSERPHGDLYDSCVNSQSEPSIFVVFDNDQYYPEYVMSYLTN